MWGGNRTWRGADAQQTLGSVIRTAHQRHLNPHALLVSSDDGLDELSISAPTRVVEVTGWHNKLLTTSVRKLPLDVVRWSSTQVGKRFRS